MEPLDFRPSTDALAALVQTVRDDQLTSPTPCPDYTVADLLDHVGGLAIAFEHAARKDPLPGGGAPVVDGANLDDRWRDRIGADLDALAAAWRDPAAYDEMTQAGPVELPAPVAASVGLNEVVVHGWDLAVATGQQYAPDPAAIGACRQFVASFEPPEGGPADDGKLFGPPIAVPADAPPLHQLLGGAGRDPHWRP